MVLTSEVKRQKLSVNQANTNGRKLPYGAVAEGAAPDPTIEKGTNQSKPKWKIGGGLKERDQLQVLKVLKENNDRFACRMDDLERYTEPPMEININTKKDIFRPPHKLGEEWAFVGEQCEKLQKLGFIRKSSQSH